MSKRKERKKTAVFELEPDGFSIHTFELSQRLTNHEYHSMKEKLYQDQKDNGEIYIYRERKGRHCCTKYSKYGVRIWLEHYSNENELSKYFVRMAVNPRKLIDPECSYLGILPPEKSSVKKVKNAFSDLFEATVFENQINNYYISRIDLCTNIRCDNEKLFRELVRVLHKLPTPPKYVRMKYKHSNKKVANKYNKHYLRLHCGTHEVVVYDKTYQMQEGNLIVAYEKLPKGVLRFEIHCERAYIRNICKKFDELDTEKLLWHMIKNSETLIIDHFSRCFPDTEFVQIKELEECIKASRFKKENKELMMELAHQLQRVQSVDKALKRMEEDGSDVSGLLDKFTKLGISPIPLWKNFCAKTLPGPVSLLKGIAEGEFQVEYIISKYV